MPHIGATDTGVRAATGVAEGLGSSLAAGSATVNGVNSGGVNSLANLRTLTGVYCKLAGEGRGASELPAAVGAL